jgi:3-hydroxyisobutyrate dehydrogenase-like beta-hydroxyacid dehydrogenase
MRVGFVGVGRLGGHLATSLVNGGSMSSSTTATRPFVVSPRLVRSLRAHLRRPPAQPLLEAMGRRIFHAGALRSASNLR